MHHSNLITTPYNPPPPQRPAECHITIYILDDNLTRCRRPDATRSRKKWPQPKTYRTDTQNKKKTQSRRDGLRKVVIWISHARTGGLRRGGGRRFQHAIIAVSDTQCRGGLPKQIMRNNNIVHARNHITYSHYPQYAEHININGRWNMIANGVLIG